MLRLRLIAGLHRARGAIRLVRERREALRIPASDLPHHARTHRRAGANDPCPWTAESTLRSASRTGGPASRASLTHRNTSSGALHSILEVSLESDEAGWDRACKVLRLEASTDDLYRIPAKKRWTPDMFIGVCDGCRLGDNHRCENSLALEESPLRLLEPPAWWVTEHFTPLFGHFGPEDVIYGLESAFPVRFVKLGMLSPAWGTRSRDPQTNESGTTHRLSDLDRRHSQANLTRIGSPQGNDDSYTSIASTALAVHGGSAGPLPTSCSIEHLRVI